VTRVQRERINEFINGSSSPSFEGKSIGWRDGFLDSVPGGGLLLI